MPCKKPGVYSNNLIENSSVPLFSVLTPTWQRASYLKRVWSALDAQSCRSFEWIVGNDGSTDDTLQVIQSLARQSNFRVVLVNADMHVGKSRIDNEMIAAAIGELCIWCDSDDQLHPNALAILENIWRAIPNERRSEYVGMAGLAEAERRTLGKLHANGSGDLSSASDISLGELEKMIGADFTLAVRTETLKWNRFPEVDLLTPESSVWCRLGDKAVRFIPYVLKFVSYSQPNAISFSGKIRYSRGRAYAIGLDNMFKRRNASLFDAFRRSLNFVRYCCHGEISFREAKAVWGGTSRQNLFLVSVLLPGLLASWIDRFRGKVEKTHIEFNKAKHSNVSIRILT